MKHLAAALLMLSTLASAQAPVLTPEQQAAREQQNQATARDHQQMLDQLGITKLRPGPSGDPKSPDSANYDEARANPYPDWPDPLRAQDKGKPDVGALPLGIKKLAVGRNATPEK